MPEMPAQQRLHVIGLQRADAVTRRLGQEARELRLRAGLSQEQLARALACSREWIGNLELGQLRVVDLRRATRLFILLGHKVVVTAYPVGEPLRDAGHVRLLERFNARLSPDWRRFAEAVMPAPGDLRAWDELLRGPVTIGVEAETRPGDLQAIGRSISGKQRDSGIDRVVLLVADTPTNRRLVQRHIGMLRQTFPLDTRTCLAALGAGRDPGADALVVL
jgi:transcriptional regulator with XRE-family HTH domain